MPYSHELNFISSWIETRDLMIGRQEHEPLGQGDASSHSWGASNEYPQHIFVDRRKLFYMDTLLI